jgi:uncharacterized protein YeaO (DUF488 family)
VPRIAIKRAYDGADDADGYRVLVDRVWPRGCTKESLKLDAWARELAPSTKLRTWFGHDPKRWTEFRKRYEGELRAPEQRARLSALLEQAGRRRITLVYGAKDEEHNQAVVLRDVLGALDRR